jgi:hypothetical protein
MRLLGLSTVKLQWSIKTMPKWKTKKGKVLKMSKMETGHIFNCIRMLTEKIKDREEMILEAELTPEPIGDIAQYEYQQGLVEYIDTCQNAISQFATKIKEFKEELEFRGVKYAK